MTTINEMRTEIRTAAWDLAQDRWDDNAHAWFYGSYRMEEGEKVIDLSWTDFVTWVGEYCDPEDYERVWSEFAPSPWSEPPTDDPLPTLHLSVETLERYHACGAIG